MEKSIRNIENLSIEEREEILVDVAKILESTAREALFEGQRNFAVLSTNMADMVSRYGKPVIVAETGMDWQQAAASKAIIADLLTRVSALGANGLGVLYWEPQAYPGWQGYTWGALDGSGRFTSAMDPF